MNAPVMMLDEVGRVVIAIKKSGQVGIVSTDFDMGATALALQKLANHLINHIGFGAPSPKQNGAPALRG